MYIANSREVQARIQKYYNRDSVVLWPSADVERFRSGETPVSQREYYIITSALTPFKRLDIPVRVLTKLGIPLKIIGSGDQKAELEKIAGPNIQFLGRLSDEEIAEYYPGIDFTPHQRVAFAAELFDDSDQRSSPQALLQSLPAAATMIQLSAPAATVRTPVIIKARV